MLKRAQIVRFNWEKFSRTGQSHGFAVTRMSSEKQIEFFVGTACLVDPVTSEGKIELSEERSGRSYDFVEEINASEGWIVAAVVQSERGPMAARWCPKTVWKRVGKGLIDPTQSATQLVSPSPVGEPSSLPPPPSPAMVSPQVTVPVTTVVMDRRVEVKRPMTHPDPMPQTVEDALATGWRILQKSPRQVIVYKERGRKKVTHAIKIKRTRKHSSSHEAHVAQPA